MILTVNEILQSSAALQQFGASKFNMNITMKVASNIRKLGEVAKEYDKKRGELVKKYGKTDDATGNTIVEPKNQEKFSALNGDLLAETVEIELKAVQISELGTKFTLEPNVAAQLEWMLIDNPPLKAVRKRDK